MNNECHELTFVATNKTMSARKLRPTGKRVLIRPQEPAEQTAGGVLLPVAYQQPATQGWVVAIGGRVEQLKPGMLVAYSWINGIEVEHEGKRLRLLPEDGVQAILEMENAK